MHAGDKNSNFNGFITFIYFLEIPRAIIYIGIVARHAYMRAHTPWPARAPMLVVRTYEIKRYADDISIFLMPVSYIAMTLFATHAAI